MGKRFLKILTVMFFMFVFSPSVSADDTTTQTVTITTRHNNWQISNIEVMISQNGETITYGTTKNGVVTFNLPSGDYTAIAGNTIGNYSYYGTIDFTVSNRNLSLGIDVDSEFSWNAAENVYNNTSYFNHVDIRVNGTYTTGIEGNTTTDKITLANVELLVVDGNNTIIDTTFRDNTETYEWRVTNKRIPKTAKVSLIFDILLNGKTIKENYEYSFEGKNDFIQAIINCDINQGLDFIMDPTEITKAVYYEVSYQWNVCEGTDCSGILPEVLATVPNTVDGYVEDAAHAIDTQWGNGVSLIDEVNNKVYTFMGWSTWSNAADAHVTKNNVDDSSIAVKDDTIIYGVWIVEDLVPTQYHLVIEKEFIGNEGIIPTNLYFEVLEPTGDKVEVPYTSFVNGSYLLPIYTNGEYVVTEKNYAIPGFNFLTETTDTIKTINIDLTRDEVVRFTNTYEKKIGNTIHRYPYFLIEKADSKDHDTLQGAIFTLIPTDANRETITSIATNESGYTHFYNIPEGTYTLKETVAPVGYHLDESEYIVTVALSNVTRNVYNSEQDAYVSVYDYVLSISPNEHYNANMIRLTIFNDEITTGNLTISKHFSENSAFKLDNLPLNEIKVVVTGENNYSNEVILNKENNWKVTLTDLPFGKYSVQEVLETSKIEGYTLEVNYQNDTTSSNEVELTKTNLEEEVKVINTYTEIIPTGSLTISKYFNENSAIKLDNLPLNEIKVVVTGENNYSKEIALNKENNWKVTLNDLQLGKYNIQEVLETSKIEGYTLEVNYQNDTTNSNEVELAKTNLDEEVKVINTYTEIIPTGSLTIEQHFSDDSEIKEEDLPGTVEFKVIVTGENDYSKEVTLNKENNWKVTLTELPLGKYSVQEVVKGAEVEGYTLEVNYQNDTTNSNEAELTKINLEEIIKIINTYTKIEKEEIIDNNIDKNNSVPQTGDSSNIYFYSLITLFGLIGLAFVSIKNSKSFNN